MEERLSHHSLRHEAVMYASDEEYLEALVPFVREGLAADDPVLVAVPEGKHALLRDALGAAADRVLLADMRQEGRNPGRILPAVLTPFADHHDGRSVRIVGEPVWPGRTRAEYPACVEHEALINVALAGRDLTVLCPYDVAGLGDRAVADAWVTHPLVVERGSRHESAEYDVAGALAAYDEDVDVPDDATTTTVRDVAELARTRALTREFGRVSGMDEEAVADLQLAVMELVTNSLRHGDGDCRVRLWREDAEVGCVVEDGGRLTDLLAGRRPAKAGAPGGRGLLIVNELADLVRVRAGATGTAVLAVLPLRRRGRRAA